MGGCIAKLQSSRAGTVRIKNSLRRLAAYDKEAALTYDRINILDKEIAELERQYQSGIDTVSGRPTFNQRDVDDIKSRMMRILAELKLKEAHKKGMHASLTRIALNKERYTQAIVDAGLLAIRASTAAIDEKSLDDQTDVAETVGEKEITEMEQQSEFHSATISAIPEVTSEMEEKVLADMAKGQDLSRASFAHVSMPVAAAQSYRSSMLPTFHSQTGYTTVSIDSH